MKVKVSYVESWTTTVVCDIDDAELKEWAEGTEITPSLVQEFLEAERDSGDVPAWLAGVEDRGPGYDFDDADIYRVEVQS